MRNVLPIITLVIGVFFGMFFIQKCGGYIKSCDECIEQQDTIWQKKYIALMDSIKTVSIDFNSLRQQMEDSILASGKWIRIEDVPTGTIIRTKETVYDTLYADTLYVDSSGNAIIDTTLVFENKIDYEDSLLTADFTIRSEGLKNFDWNYKIKPIEIEEATVIKYLKRDGLMINANYIFGTNQMFFGTGWTSRRYHFQVGRDFFNKDWMLGGGLIIPINRK